MNPLLRAVALARDLEATCAGVTLALPWLAEPEDQAAVFRAGTVFSSPGEQEAAIRAWLGDECDVNDWGSCAGAADGGSERRSAPLDFTWYPARYHPALGCILFDAESPGVASGEAAGKGGGGGVASGGGIR